jgi:putative membrane protein
MWSWWDCVQWWNAVSDGSAPWLMFLPMMLWPIVVIGGIVTLVILVSRGARTERRSTWRRDAGRQTAFDILRERFARGEIDQREFEERKGLLSQP